MLHILQHIPTDGPALIAQWLRERDRPHRVIRIDQGEALPCAAEVSELIILGGTMNVDQESEFPWLRAEKRLAEAHLRAGRPVLGVCLGGQLMAQVLGGVVSRNGGWEIGWHPVAPVARSGETSGAMAKGLFASGEALEFFHWHEDTFSIPQGARRLASSAGCPNQAFAVHDRAIGLQFHPEVDEEWIRLALSEVSLPLARSEADRIQSPQAMLEGLAARIARTRRFLFELLDSVFAT